MRKSLSPQDYRNHHKRCSFCVHGYRPPDESIDAYIFCYVKDKMKCPNIPRLCRYYQARKIKEYYFL